MADFLQIHNEQLVRQLRSIAERENRSVEKVIETLLEDYKASPQAVVNEPQVEKTLPDDSPERLRQMKLKYYARARKYWAEHGDTVRANLTDAEMDVQFWLFDGEGIPRLKSEQGNVEIPENSSIRLGEIAEKANILLEYPIDPTEADDILREEYPDYVLRRMQDEGE